ncbi:MAG: TIGR02206 family membrane protein [Verrucomicrobiae bacterium]|nr:TIGR02206 family membrane protein [Verrucomicrobiae bacterium]
MPISFLAATSSDLPFRTGSATHLISLAVCAVIVFAFVRLIRNWRAIPDSEKRHAKLHRLRLFIGCGCLAAWLMNVIFWAVLTPFRWDQSLPLQFCNLANLIGAVAVMRRSGRLFKSVLYFWATTLCIWAFITPVLGSGPDRLEFWIFWIYHIFIPLAVLETFLVQGFRPGFPDLKNTVLFTLTFTLLMALIDRIFGWNYGFVGPSTPENPTLLDVLGPYPLRLLWMILIASGLFLLVWLPWRKVAQA